MAFVRWLEEGCPAGIVLPIEKGGWFPDVADENFLSEDEVDFEYRAITPPLRSWTPTWCSTSLLGGGALVRAAAHAASCQGCSLFPLARPAAPGRRP